MSHACEQAQGKQVMIAELEAWLKAALYSLARYLQKNNLVRTSPASFPCMLLSAGTLCRLVLWLAGHSALCHQLAAHALRTGPLELYSCDEQSILHDTGKA